MSDTSILLKARRENDRNADALAKTHRILNDPTFSDDEKYVMLVSEQGFGSVRAQELVYGKIVFKKKYESAEDTQGYEKYYVKEVRDDLKGDKR